MEDEQRYKDAIDWGVEHGYSLAIKDILYRLLFENFKGHNPEKLEEAIQELNETFSISSRKKYE
jgi:hypothetical protein